MSRFALMEEVLSQPERISEAASHEDWRIRYAAAIAIARYPDARWLTVLHQMLIIESQRPLYTQPVVNFSHGTGDTRMAEQIGPLTVMFDHPYDESTKDAWRCRGRVRQAVLFAVAVIGHASPELLEMMHAFLADPHEDFAVKAATARALGAIGDPASVPFLHIALAFDEWCTNREAAKALARIVS